jgi:hypothetical protein
MEDELALWAFERYVVACGEVSGPSGARPVAVVEHAEVNGSGAGVVIPHRVGAQRVTEQASQRRCGEQVGHQDPELLTGGER